MAQLKETANIVQAPERAALAAAISRLDLARKQAVAANAAVEGLDQHRREAEAAVESAEAAYRLAQHDAVESSISGRPFLTLRDARQALEDAQDRLTALVASEARLEKQATESVGEVSWAQDAVRDRIVDVVRDSPNVSKLLADYESTKAAMAHMRVALRVLYGNGGGRHGCLQESARFWESEKPINLTAAERPWREAIARLETDADAALPE